MRIHIMPLPPPVIEPPKPAPGQQPARTLERLGKLLEEAGMRVDPDPQRQPDRRRRPPADPGDPPEAEAPAASGPAATGRIDITT